MEAERESTHPENIFGEESNKKTSVIIPTVNRPDQIYKLAISLIALDSLEELIIVDQSEEGNRKLEALSQEDQRIRIIKSSRKGSPYAKNLGAKFAEGKILIFLDDDVEIHGDIISAHLKAYKNSNIGAVGGKVIEKPEKIFPDSWVGKVKLWSFIVRGHFNSNKRQFIDTAVSCNMSIRKSLFDLLGGFDEGFKGNAIFEETDLCLRLKKEGYKILFEPLAIITHHKVPFGGNRVDRLSFYFWLIANNLRLFLKNFPSPILPFFLFLQIIRLIKKALQEKDFNILKVGIKGICYALKNRPQKI
ncbi:MAG: glycosyltransferase family 2 protein [bacterium]